MTSGFRFLLITSACGLGARWKLFVVVDDGLEGNCCSRLDGIFLLLATAKLLIFMIRWCLVRKSVWKLRISWEPFGDLETSLLYLNRRIREKVFHHHSDDLHQLHIPMLVKKMRVYSNRRAGRGEKGKWKPAQSSSHCPLSASIFRKNLLLCGCPRERAHWHKSSSSAENDFSFRSRLWCEKSRNTRAIRALESLLKKTWKLRENFFEKKGTSKLSLVPWIRVESEGRKSRYLESLRIFHLSAATGRKNLLFSSRQVTSKLDFSLYWRKVQLTGKQSLTEPWKKGQPWKMKKRQCEK